MRLRSRNSRSMERGTDTSRPNRKRERFSRAEACSAGRRLLNYALVRARGVSEISERVDPKRENAERELGEASEGCSILAAKRLEKCAVRERRGSYAASFVTKECAISLACDPTIFISCQS